MRGRIERLLRDHFAAVCVAIVAVLGGAYAVTVIDEDGDGQPDRVFIDVHLPHAGTVTVDRGNERQSDETREAELGTKSPAPPAGVQLDPAATPDVHEDTRDETPGKPGLENGPTSAKRTAPGVGPPVRVGGAQNYSCRAHYVVNQSALQGRRSMFVLHFTVSAPGSLDAIRRLFNTPSFGASSNLGLELAGRCEIWVPFGRKAWTQGAFNSAGESVEIVTFDRTRQQWLTSPILQRGILAQITADRLKARGLPPKLVDPVGCTPKAGVTDHERLECGNTHYDVGRNFPWGVFMQQVRRAYYGGNPVRPAPTVTPKALSFCKQRNRYRRTLAAGGKLTAGQRSRLHRLERALERKYECGRRGATTVIRRKA